jgi:hypothetical protein
VAEPKWNATRNCKGLDNNTHKQTQLTLPLLPVHHHFKEFAGQSRGESLVMASAEPTDDKTRYESLRKELVATLPKKRAPDKQLVSLFSLQCSLQRSSGLENV